MPGFEVFGKEEQAAINKIFELNGGILFAHGFDAQRNGVYRVREYEQAFRSIFSTQYAQATSSGSSAIKVGLKALGIGTGDEVITQSYTFVATVEAVFETGATPIIVDVDDTLNMDPKALEAAITPRTKAIMPVHMMGEAADMDAINEIAARHGLPVVEDTAQALGAKLHGKLLGTIGKVGVFSTDAGKTLCTGEGGMIITNDEEVYKIARSFHDHGHDYTMQHDRGNEGALCRGFNYRMTELQAAIGIEQLKKLDMIVGAQKANKAKLLQGLDLGMPFRRSLDPQGDNGELIVFFMPDRDRTAAFTKAMRQAGLGTKNLPDAIKWHFSKHWDHMFHDHPLYSNRAALAWSQSADILECSIALPVMIMMDDARIDYVVTTLNKIAKDVL
ncbi:MAG: DegT/DnrJ/EryC1/StrS family aminotransferase [Rhodospirillales bacterium]